MSDSITLTDDELQAITGYEQATKQLRVLHDRGFTRAFIDRNGDLVLERAHYEAVVRGEFGRPPGATGRGANLSFLRAA